jgi:hypothetical protein
VQRAAKGVLGHPLPRGAFQDLLEQGHRPTRVRVAEIPGRDGEEGLEQVLLVFVQRRVATPACLAFERGRIVVLRISFDPIVDTLAGYTEHAGDVGGGATMVELQDGESPPKQASIAGLGELPAEAPPLPGSQVEPAHGFLPH